MYQCELIDAATLSQDLDWWALYDASFPSCEREPRTAILDSIGTGRAIALRAVLHGATVGLGVAYLLKGMPFVFVAYLAVSDEARGHRLGARLMDWMFAIGTLRLKRLGLECRGLVLEAEDPHLAVSDEARAERLKRLGFFEKLGARVLPTPYVQPAIDGESEVPLNLLVIDRDPRKPFANLEGPELIRAMYFEKYAPVNGIDPPTLASLMNVSAPTLPQDSELAF
ncbi:MAG TPA: GNAT family N-acetyltransferase [Stenomitos sp.]